MTNPFDDPNGKFFVVVNDENQHALWPAFADIPLGWTSAHGAAGREDCLAYVEKHWTDMRPASLIREMEKRSE
ncbi:MbtH family protein [Streptomyces tailanensis]|uniref:MbtH family protein n=1 Tax=Streptomyces tailanensis TaxID=2569858 RepID=UPI00122DE476|nr:MbtH family protein [Streptomyces tailanensis]